MYSKKYSNTKWRKLKFRFFIRIEIGKLLTKKRNLKCDKSYELLLRQRIIDRLKSVATILIVPTELLRYRAVGSKHIVGMDFNPSTCVNIEIKNHGFEPFISQNSKFHS